MGVARLIVDVLDIFQVLLDVLNRQKLENLLFFYLIFLFFVKFNLSNSFLQLSGFKCKSLSILLW